MALADPLGAAIGCGDLAVRRQQAVIGAEPHRAAEVARRVAPLEDVAAQPFGEAGHNRLGTRPTRSSSPARYGRDSVPLPINRHLHAEADAK